jgi:predicted dienelactone hydrolase
MRHALAGALSAALGVACADERGDTGAVDLVASLGAPGAHPVGYREASLDYPDPDPAAEGAARSLRLALWYPAAEAEGGEAAYLGGAIPAEGVLDAPEALAGPLPVAIFSHGHQGYAENSGFLMEHLASHGFVVAAPDHTGNTTFDGGDRETAIYYQRPADVSAVLDALLEGAVEGLPAVQEPAGLLGHSFGGYTAFALAGAAYDAEVLADCLSGVDTSDFCATMDADAAARFQAGLGDPRFAAVVAMASGDQRLFGSAGLAELGAPVLHMTGSLDDADDEAYWEGLAGRGHLRVDLLGGGHQSFTDYSGVLESGEGLIAAEDGFRIIDSFALAWLRWGLLGDESVLPVLEGEVAVDAAAVLSR